MAGADLHAHALEEEDLPLGPDLRGEEPGQGQQVAVLEDRALAQERRAGVAGGKAGEAEVLYSDGPAVFATAAAEALGNSTFDEGRTRATVWYVFRLLQDTKTTDVSAEAGRALDADPELLEYVAPEFPPGAPSLRLEITVDLLVSPDGRVWHAEVTDTGANELYVERALAAARQFTFNPATLDGKPTMTWYPFIIEFN